MPSKSTKKKESVRMTTITDTTLNKLRRQLIREGAPDNLSLEDTERYIIETYPDFDDQKIDAEITRLNDAFEREANDLDFKGFTPESTPERLPESTPERLPERQDIFTGNTQLKTRPTDLFTDDIINGRNIVHMQGVTGRHVIESKPESGLDFKHDVGIVYHPDTDEGKYIVQDGAGVIIPSDDASLGMEGNILQYPSDLPDNSLQAEYDKLQEESDILQGRSGNVDQFTVTDVEGIPTLHQPSLDEMKEIEMNQNQNGDDYDFYTDPSQANIDTSQSAWTRNLQSINIQHDRGSINRRFGLNREFFEGVSGAAQAGGNDVNQGLSSGISILEDIVENGTRVAGWFTNTGLAKIDGDESKIVLDNVKGLADLLSESRDAINSFDFSGLLTSDADRDGEITIKTAPAPSPGPSPGPKAVSRPTPRPTPRPTSRPVPRPVPDSSPSDIREFRKKGELYPYKIPSAHHKTNFVNLIRNDKATLQKAIHLLDP